MNIKKKRSLLDLLRAALVVLLVIGVPIWLMMIVMITRSAAACIGLICYVSIGYIIGRRFE